MTLRIRYIIIVHKQLELPRMKIEKSYEENVITGPFQSVKIGLTIKTDKEVQPADLEEFSGKLLMAAKTIVRKELQQVKQEKKETDNE